MYHVPPPILAVFLALTLAFSGAAPVAEDAPLVPVAPAPVRSERIAGLKQTVAAVLDKHHYHYTYDESADVFHFPLGLEGALNTADVQITLFENKISVLCLYRVKAKKEYLDQVAQLQTRINWHSHSARLLMDMEDGTMGSYASLVMPGALPSKDTVDLLLNEAANMAERHGDALAAAALLGVLPADDEGIKAPSGKAPARQENRLRLRTVVEACLQDSHYAYSFREDSDTFHFSQDSWGGTFQYAISIRVLDEGLYVLFAPSFSVPEENRVKAAQLITLFNWDRNMAQMLMNMDTGELAVSVALPADGDYPGQDELEDALVYGVDLLDWHMDALVQVALTGADPKTTFDEAWK